MGMILNPYVFKTSPTVAYLTTVGDEVDRSSYTFSSVPFGDADGGRYIIVGVAHVTSSVTGVTVDGNSATLAHSSGNLALYIVNLPTGTSGSVVVSMAGTAARCAISVYSAKNITSMTPVYDSAADNTDPGNLDCDIPGPSIAIGLGFSNVSTSATWTGLTEDYDGQPFTVTLTTASASLTDAETPRTITCDVASATGFNSIAAVWQ